MEEIIPKPVKKPSSILVAIFYVAIAIIVVLVLSYVCLIDSEKKSKIILSNLEESLAGSITLEEQRLEREVLLYQRKIDDFTLLLASHESLQDFFKLLEESSHPNVWFSGFSFNASEHKLNLIGDALNFESAEQQINMFRGLNEILNTRLSNIAIKKDATITFSLELSLAPELFFIKIIDDVETTTTTD